MRALGCTATAGPQCRRQGCSGRARHPLLALQPLMRATPCSRHPQRRAARSAQNHQRSASEAGGGSGGAMVKQRMGSVDVAGEVACLRSKVVGLRLANLYDLNAKVGGGRRALGGRLRSKLDVCVRATR